MITLFHFIRNKFMHVITYWHKFAPQHLAAPVVRKNNPHSTIESHTSNINMFYVYPFRMELFLFLYTRSTQFCTA